MNKHRYLPSLFAAGALNLVAGVVFAATDISPVLAADNNQSGRLIVALSKMSRGQEAELRGQRAEVEARGRASEAESRGRETEAEISGHAPKNELHERRKVTSRPSSQRPRRSAIITSGGSASNRGHRSSHTGSHNSHSSNHVGSHSSHNSHGSNHVGSHSSRSGHGSSSGHSGSHGGGGHSGGGGSGRHK